MVPGSNDKSRRQPTAEYNSVAATSSETQAQPSSVLPLWIQAMAAEVMRHVVRVFPINVCIIHVCVALNQYYIS